VISVELLSNKFASNPSMMVVTDLDGLPGKADSAARKSCYTTRSDALKTSIARARSTVPLTSHRHTTPYRRKRTGKSRPVLEAFVPDVDDEVLVVDDRASMRPTQIIESKLTRLLQDANVPVSHLQTRSLLKIR
jgi:hypothetical protein